MKTSSVTKKRKSSELDRNFSKNGINKKQMENKRHLSHPSTQLAIISEIYNLKFFPLVCV
jgi:hypothetical protein